MATEHRSESDLRQQIISLRSQFVDVIYPTEILDFMFSFPSDLCETIRETGRRQRRKAAEMFMDKVISDDDDGIRDEFMVGLDANWYDRFVKPILGETSSISKVYTEYAEFIIKRVEGQLVREIKPLEILQSLVHRRCLNVDDVEVIEAFNRERGSTEACREMFSRLKARQEDWALQFCEVLGQHGYQHLVTKADPSASPDELLDKNVVFRNEESSMASGTDNEQKIHADRTRENKDLDERMDYMSHSEDADTDLKCENVQEPMDVESNVPVDDEEPMGCDSDYDIDKSEIEASEKAEQSDTRPTFKLRSYQTELADKALKGHNTIICADTNTGKTWVALFLAKCILESPGRGNRKIVFMARTNPLVVQQFNLFKRYLPDFKICLLSKDDINSTKMSLVMDDNDVFFMTPQILVNNLKEGSVKLTMFSLMILDECHHTDKGEPYNMLMRQYIKHKKESPFEPRPQVIGLTATIGVGNATSDHQAVDHMLKICANLDVKTIATVEDNIEEMRKHTSRPKEEQMGMKERHEDPCKVEIIQAMRKVEEVLDESMSVHHELFLQIKERPINDYQSKRYQQWLVTTRNNAVSLLSDNKEMSRQIVSAIQYLLSYNEALDINYLMNEKYVLEHLAKKFKKEKSQQSCLTDYELNLLSLYEELQPKLQRISKHPGAVNPNLQMLVNVLKNKFSESTQTSRGIVFVETRATAFALSEYLDSIFKVDVDAKCRPFTGNKTSENAEGMGETEKKALLENFRSGEIKLLVATSVGSEGIDIPECNIVVKYNYSGNEVSVIQMRGRLRKKGGTTIHLGDYKTQQRDSVNMQKAAMMYRALELLKKLDQAEREKRIAEYQRQDMSSEAVKQHAEQIKEGTKVQAEFRMKCFKCKTFAIDGNQIRKYAKVHHAVTDPTFFDRIRIEPLEKKKQITFDNMTKQSKILCQECTNIFDWGVMFLIDGQEVPVLKSDPFVFEHVVSGKDRPYKKWKDVPYKVQDIEKDELLQLLYPITE